MKKLAIITFLFLLTNAVHAQWRVRVQSGPAFSLTDKKKDSLFFGDKAFHVQGNATYYWGHLGLGITVGLLKQQPKDSISKQKPPAFISDTANFTAEGGGTRSVYILAGPEICLACTPKLKLNIGLRLGVSLLQMKKNTVLINQQSVLRYRNVISSKAPFTINAGIGFHYFFDTHWGAGLMADYHTFKLKAVNNDYRFSIGNARTLSYRYHFLNTGASLVYKF